MSLTIRCTGCKKKISVDEAFAGGVCRCPYCKELVMVAKSGGSAPALPVERPDAPPGDSPQNPLGVAPTVTIVTNETVVHATAVDESAVLVPMANPVRMQGVFTIILAVLLLAIIGGVVLFAVVMMPKQQSETASEEPSAATTQQSTTAPSAKQAANAKGGAAADATKDDKPAALASTATVAGLSIEAPVVYILDNGRTMQEVFPYAQALARLSIRSLKPAETFNIMICQEENDIFMGEEFRGGGSQGDKAAEEFLDTVSTHGVTNIERGIASALAKKPKTVVLFRRRAVENAAVLGTQVRAAEAKLITVVLDGDEQARSTLEEMAKAAEGKCKSFSSGELSRSVSLD